MLFLNFIAQSMLISYRYHFLKETFSVPIKLIFFSKSAFLLGTCRFIFNFAIVKHVKNH